VQKPLEQVRSPLVADAEEVAAEQPGKRALGHPAETPQPLAGVDPAAAIHGIKVRTVTRICN
jgi:hypothetical protein